MHCLGGRILLVVLGLCFPLVWAVAQSTLTFTSTQAIRGEEAYSKHCVSCHGTYLTGTQFGPPLRSDNFLRRWAGRPLSQLLSFVKTTMPPGGGSRLPDESYIEVLSYLFESYGMTGGEFELSTQTGKLESVIIPSAETLAPSLRAGGYILATDAELPEWPAKPNPLDYLSPVTEAVLNSPPAGSWPVWRRTRDGSGFSPLNKITRNNVGRLRVAWTLALPPGPNQTTPLVHDGVIFAHGYGDYILAIDAETGDELWHFHWEMPTTVATTVHRNMVLYEDKLYFATSDAYVVALYLKTGEVAWKRWIGDETRKVVAVTGGPLIANNVLMQGMTSGFSPGGGYIVGIDTATGNVLWRFNTVAQPGEPNGNSWNDLPAKERAGGSVWTAGSYDAKSNLALFGPAPTYLTAGLRTKPSTPGISNDALYTDATIALDPLTGKLIWHYQHLQNDQWDMDWAFERHIIDMTVEGRRQRLVVTAGKQAIYDAIDAQTGKYVFSIDLGLQNLVTAIDQKTGLKTIDAGLMPDNQRALMICPHLAGAKSWLPASYNPAVQTVYVPLVESCMEMIPSRRGLLHGAKIRPRAGSDGKYGRLQAIDLASRRTIWTNRQRAPQTTGALATAGGLVFAGALDRFFSAYDADDGHVLWRLRLSDAPNAAPITYLVNDKQYVAVIVGAGYGQSETFRVLAPEMKPAIKPNSTLWVFELGPEDQKNK